MYQPGIPDLDELVPPQESTTTSLTDGAPSEDKDTSSITDTTREEASDAVTVPASTARDMTSGQEDITAAPDGMDKISALIKLE